MDPTTENPYQPPLVDYGGPPYEPPPVHTKSVLAIALGSYGAVVLLFIIGQFLLLLNIPLGLMATSLLIFGAAGIFFPASLGQLPRVFTGLRRVPWKLVALSVAISAINLPFANFLMGAARELLPARWSETADDTTRMLANADNTSRILLVIAAGIAAPIGEELFFRGWLQTMLSQRLRQVVSVLIVSAIFSATHFDPVGFVARVELGLLFGFARAWTGSLLPGIAMHATHNLLSTAALYLVSDDPMAELNEPFDWKSTGLFAVVSLCIVLSLITFFQRKANEFKEAHPPPAPQPFRFTPGPASRILTATSVLLVATAVLLFTFRARLPGASLSRPEAPHPELTPVNPTKTPHLENGPQHLK